jgi:hypothetical protein
MRNDPVVKGDSGKTRSTTKNSQSTEIILIRDSVVSTFGRFPLIGKGREDLE